MFDKFMWGIALGMIGGALIASNSVKARQAVREGQEQVMQKAQELTKSSKQKSSK